MRGESEGQKGSKNKSFSLVILSSCTLFKEGYFEAERCYDTI